jgi:hypothetical protein
MSFVTAGTHLAVAIAMEAIAQGLPVYFVTLAQLMNDLRKANEENRLDRCLPHNKNAENRSVKMLNQNAKKALVSTLKSSYRCVC